MLTQKDLLKRGINYIGFPWNFPESMPKLKIERFLNEFPWVKSYVNGEIAHVYVTVIEKSFLEYTTEKFDNLTDVGQEWMYFLDKKGEIITNTIEVERKKYFLFGPVIKKTVTDSYQICGGVLMYNVLHEMGEAIKSIHFIFSYCENTQAVIVYKLPKSVSLYKLMKKTTNEVLSAAVTTAE